MDLDYYNVTPEGEERSAAVGQMLAGSVLVIVWAVLDDGSHRTITAYPLRKASKLFASALRKGE